MTMKKDIDLTNSGQNPRVTSGRDGGVGTEEEEPKSKPKLNQGETLSGLKENGGKGESENATRMRKAININGGQLVDPAYREIGDGGEAGNTGNLGMEKGKEQEKGKDKGRESKL